MKLRIVNKRKFIISTSILIFSLLTCGCVVMSAKPSNEILSYEKIYIGSGDTLWNIAQQEKIYNEYYLDKDIRYIIYDLKKINNLKDSNIIEGQELYIPVNNNR